MKLGEDQIFILDYLLCAKKACCISDTMYYYRDNVESAVHNSNPESVMESVRAFKELKQRNPLAKKQCDNMLLAWLLTLCISTNVTTKEIEKLYKDVTLEYCSPRCNIKNRIIYWLFCINHSLAIRLIKIAKR